MCERCRKIPFIATSSGIQLSRSGGGMYRLNCPPPCAEMKDFRKDGMRPYRVAEEVFRTGYASEGDYELVDESTTPRKTPNVRSETESSRAIRSEIIHSQHNREHPRQNPRRKNPIVTPRQTPGSAEVTLLPDPYLIFSPREFPSGSHNSDRNRPRILPAPQAHHTSPTRQLSWYVVRWRPFLPTRIKPGESQALCMEHT
jgi:hypothetical protein